MPVLALTTNMTKLLNNRVSPTHAGVSADNQHGEVWRVAGQAEYRRLEVLVVASQVN